MFRPRTLCQMKPAPDPSMINPHKTSLPEDYFNSFPEYQGNPKEFPSRTKKPLQITTKGYLMQKIDKKYIEEIQPKEQMIDFNKILVQFKSPEEIQSLQVKDLLDIDSEMLEELKKSVRISQMLLQIYQKKKKDLVKQKKQRVINNLCNI